MHIQPAAVVLAASLVLLFAVSAANAAVIGYWTLDDSTPDTVNASIGPDGTYENFTSGQLGKTGNPLNPSGKSVEFESGSSNDRINLGADGGIVSGKSALTMAMWVKFGSLTQDNTLASIGTFGSGAPLIFWRDEDSSGTPNTIAVLIGSNRTAGGANALNDTDWHHLAFTYEANTSGGLKLYVDGQEAGSTNTSSSAIPTSLDPLVLGNASNGPSAGKQFDGLMDEVGLWDSALPADTLLAMATGELVGGKSYSQLIGANGYTVSSGTVIFDGANEYTGVTAVNGGVLRVAHADALGTTDGGTTVANGAQLELAGGVTVDGESITITGGGGNSRGALQSQSGANTWTGNVTLGSSGTRIGANGSGQSLTISGVIGDGGNNYTLAVRNADEGGTVVLSGGNTYGGNTDIVVGPLQIAGGDNRLPIGTVLRIGNTSNVASATFDLNGQNQQVAGLASLGTTMSRTVTNSSGTPSTLTVNNASDYTYAGAITGNLALTKGGSGRLTLSGDNSYTGATAVTGGALRVASDDALAQVPQFVRKMNCSGSILG